MAVGRSEEVKHPLLKKLKTLKKLMRFIQESGDRQWASRVRGCNATVESRARVPFLSVPPPDWGSIVSLIVPIVHLV